MRYIQLTMNKKAIVDDEDYEYLNQFKWRTNKIKSTGNCYAVREIWNDGDRYSEHMHRIVLERKIGRKLKKKELTDHINHNGLDNRKENLRVVSQSENMTNITRRKDNTTGYTGIHFNKAKNKFEVYINKNYKRKRLGRYKNLDEAISVRKMAEKEYWDDKPNISTE